MSVKWYGDKVMQALEDANEAGLIAVGIAIQGQAKLLSPVDDGRLRRSISYTTNTKRSLGGRDGVQTNANKGEVIIGTNVEYSVLVEYGTGMFGEHISGMATPRRQTPWVYFDEKRKSFFWTSGMKPQSFMRRSVDALRSRLDSIYSRGFKSSMNKSRNANEPSPKGVKITDGGITLL